MNFGDKLRAETKTKAQLEADGRQKQQREFEQEIAYQVRRLKKYCEYAAERGQRELSSSLERYSDEDYVTRYFDSPSEAERWAQALEASLQAEGLTDLDIHIAAYRPSMFARKSYRVDIAIRW